MADRPWADVADHGWEHALHNAFLEPRAAAIFREYDGLDPDLIAIDALARATHTHRRGHQLDTFDDTGRDCPRTGGDRTVQAG